MQNESTLLHNGQGSSDKVYIAELVQTGNEGTWACNFRYGRRVPGDGYVIQGGTSGTKSTGEYESVLAVYRQLVASKRDNGYDVISENVSGFDAPSSVTVTEVKPKSGFLPMLLIAIDDEVKARQLCDNPSYCMQEKMDGQRRMLFRSLSTGIIQGINRKGEFVSFPRAIQSGASFIETGSFLLDGEEIGETYHLFDILMKNEDDLKSTPMKVRYHMLREIAAGRDSAIQVVRTAFSKQEKHDLFDQVKARGGEGVVFKLVAAPYVVGRSKYALKYKLKGAATIQVLGVNGTKRSVQMGTLDAEGNLTFSGNVTIPVNYEIPDPGTLAEVEYLYVTGPGGSLYQPVYLGPRFDKDQPDSYASLKFKSAGAQEDSEEDPA